MLLSVTLMHQATATGYIFTSWVVLKLCYFYVGSLSEGFIEPSLCSVGDLLGLNKLLLSAMATYNYSRKSTSQATHSNFRDSDLWEE